MNANRWAALLLLVLLIGIVALGFWLRDDTPETVAQAAAPTAPPPRSPESGPMLSTGAPPVSPAPRQDSPLPELPPVTVDAAQSMSTAREHGDARAPAVVRDAPREMPTAAELADPEAYQRYEARQSQRLRRAYVKAADTEIPRLQQDIERARREGLSDAQIAEGEEKLRRIQAMRDQLQAEGAANP